MYIPLSIINADNLKQKSYISFYFEGKRQRLYSGGAIGLKLFPNRAKTVEERFKRLNAIKDELQRLLESNQYPYEHANDSFEADKVITLMESLNKKASSPNELNGNQKLALRKLLKVLKLLLENLGQ